MIQRSILRLVMTFCFFAFVFTIGAILRPAFGQCENVTDAQIVSTIYGKIKADKGLVPQIPHINVISTNAAVKFQGWTENKKDHDKVVGFGVDTACVRLVNVNSFEEIPPTGGGLMRGSSGCTSGTKPCGDLCIPDGDTCNITSTMGFHKPIFLFDMDRSFAKMTSEGSATCTTSNIY